MKRNLKLIIFTIITYLMFCPRVYAIDYNNICNNSEILNTIRIIGIIIAIIKVVIPLLIIIFGMIDFGKAVISSDEKEINKSTTRLIKRIIVGISIYFIPTIILTLFDVLEISEIHNSDNFYKCTTCLLDTNTCEVEQNNSSENIENNEGTNNNEIDGIDENGNYHINSINNKKFIIYDQMDSRWSDLSLAGSDGTGTVGTRGCNMISTSVILSSYDSNYTPYDYYYSGYKSSHPYDAINKLTNNEYSCSYKSLNNQDIVDYLQKGYVAIILVYGGERGNSKFTSDQHYMALIDISSDGNKIFVGNSYNNGNSSYSKSGWFSTSDVLTSVAQVHLCKVS